MNEINELATALAKAQAEMTSAEMDKVNPHFKSKYASLNSLQQATRPVLAKHGLSLCQLPVDTENGLMLETHLMHTSGQQLVSSWPIPNDTNLQKIGSNLTYIKRYVWSSICGIAGDDDDDGNSAAPQPQPQQRQHPTQNGNGKVNNPAALLEYVNKAVEVKYSAIPHLFNALKNELGDNFQWPQPDDKDGWKTAYGVAKMHAEAKAQASIPDGQPDLDEVFNGQ